MKILRMRVMLASWPVGALAHDGGAQEMPILARHLRTWTHASGRYHVHGSFVATHGDLVQVRREDGGLVAIKLEALSDPDREWVEGRRAAIGRLNLLAQGPRG